MANIKPSHEVHVLPGKRMRTYQKVRVDEKGKNIGGFDTYEEEVDAGYMVYVPNGSSVHAWDDAHLATMGLDKDQRLIDMDTGDEVGTVNTSALKSRSEQKTSKGRTSRPGLGATEGVSS